MIDEKSIPSKNPSILCTELDEEAVLLDLKTKCYFGLNEVALFIWKLADGKRNVSDIVDEICKNFDVEPSTALNSVKGFLKKLNDNNLVFIDASS
ncbi:MAG: PqqD family protein [Candidatus Schekmanbacteria bacterium]|nr:MAG: PqqD family protein [Candidatus Schekmanbacteria bacterium]